MNLHQTKISLLFAITAFCSAGALGAKEAPPAKAVVQSLPTAIVQSQQQGLGSSYDATIEAVRQSTIAAQVAGNITQLPVKAGQQLAKGQVLLQIDSRAAQDGAVAAQAQVAAAQAQVGVARANAERQRQLYAQKFIAKAALDQAEAAYTAAQAQLKAASAQASAAGTQTGFFTIRSPYAGIVSQVNVEQGSMVMPGAPLLTVYEPGAMRAVAAVPAMTTAGRNTLDAKVHINGALLQPTRIEVLPTTDATTLTQTVRAYLPANTHLAPGMFARLVVSGANVAQANAKFTPATLTVPASAIVRRAELVGVYVLSKGGQPLLRQIRLGQTMGDSVQVLSGLDAGERVVTQPALVLRPAAP